MLGERVAKGQGEWWLMREMPEHVRRLEAERSGQNAGERGLLRERRPSLEWPGGAVNTVHV